MLQFWLDPDWAVKYVAIFVCQVWVVTGFSLVDRTAEEGFMGTKHHISRGSSLHEGIVT